MSGVLVVDRVAQGVRIGLLEDGRLIEVDLAEPDPAGPGAVCLGRVRTVARELDGAFVDCGLGQDAFLGARDARALSGARRRAGIGEQVGEGEAVLVQVKRPAQGNKGPRIGTDVALPGLGLLHRPRSGRAGLTPEISRGEEAKRQQARAEALFPGGGFSLRPAALLLSDRDLADEAERLRASWAEIEARAGAAKPPALLAPPPESLQRLLLAHFRPDPERIVLAERTLLIEARRWLAQWPRWRERIGERLEYLPDAFETTGAAPQLDEALDREVALPGGYLIIEPTAALTAIDVNGAGRPLEVDLAAAREVARQLRLRRIGGLVVIDFVDLESRRERARLDAALRGAFAADPAAVQLYPMSPLGLVELSRQRLGPSLAEQLGRAAAKEEAADE
ncbi:MAG TPA: ribonuclease E/G [Geminicoccaceae bacterium]|nr:ribonuclease E/G [Geminicoccaceae bacterium]